MEAVDTVSRPFLVSVREVSLVRGGRSILDAVSFDVFPGEVVALMGASGSGKTTLLRAMLGLDPLAGGQMQIDKVALHPGHHTRQTLAALRRTVGMVFQFHGLFEHLSVLDNVSLALVHVHGVRREQARARGRELLGRFGVEDRSAALPRELSGGEAQRVAIARALAVDPRILLMDEPTASLDAGRRAELAGIVKGLGEQRRAVIVATHDEEFACRAASRVLRVIDHGICEEPPRALPRQPEGAPV